MLVFSCIQIRLTPVHTCPPILFRSLSDLQQFLHRILLHELIRSYVQPYRFLADRNRDINHLHDHLDDNFHITGGGGGEFLIFDEYGVSPKPGIYYLLKFFNTSHPITMESMGIGGYPLCFGNMRNGIE